MFGTSWDDPKTMATLQMAAGLLSGGNFGQALGRGLSGYSTAMQSAEEADARKSERAYTDLVRQLKLEEIKKAQEQEVRQKNWIASQNPVSRAMSSGGGPTVANAAQVNPGQVDAYRLLEAGLISPADYAKQFVLPKEVEIKDYKEVRNPDGSVSIVGFTKDGKPVNTNQTPFKAPEVRDFGGYVGGVDPITGQVRRYGDKTMSPDAKASNAVAWANVDNARQRLAFDMRGGVDGVNGGGKLPPGFRWNNGQAEPIPGTPQDRDAQKSARERQSSMESARSALNLIDAAIKHPGRATATGLSGVLSPSNYIPGTAASDFQAIRDQIAGGAFLQAFESLKGGGAITEVEGKKAEQAIARLQTSQSDAAFLQALQDYREVIQKGVARMGTGTGATGSWGGSGFKILSVE